MSLGDIRNLDYTILRCSKMQETKEFYLHVSPGLAWDDGPIPPGSAAVQLAFRIPPHMVDACHEALQSKGVAILSPPREIPNWRHRALFFRDPEGNVVELYAET